MKHWKWTLGVVLLALPGPSMGGFARGEPKLYTLSGEEAPLNLVIDTFLGQASVAYADEDPEFFEVFCNLLGIDSSWPSAQQLGTALPEINEEYLARLQEASQVSSTTDLQGRDPNEWKNEAIGRAFGEVYEGLRRDGLPMDLDVFIAMIEHQVRGTFEGYSDKPFDKKALANQEAQFWNAAAETSLQVESLRSKGGEQ
ncbi:MAG: hypothetical protein WBP34_17450 [Thermoanaerobaculia bacterium]